MFAGVRCKVGPGLVLFGSGVVAVELYEGVYEVAPDGSLT